MRCREYPDRVSAEAGKLDGEVVVAVKRSDGSVLWGVIPAVIEVDQGEGREPVRQPAGDFIAQWWSEVESLAREEHP